MPGYHPLQKQEPERGGACFMVFYGCLWILTAPPRGWGMPVQSRLAAEAVCLLILWGGGLANQGLVYTQQSWVMWYNSLVWLQVDWRTGAHTGLAFQ